MTRPTDDELEATAAELQRFAANALIDRVAAMLRACKTADAPDHAEWDAAIDAAIAKARQVGFLSIEDLQALKKGQTNE